MQKINEVKAIESLSQGTSELILRIYFLELAALMGSLLFGDEGFYGFLFKILLFGQLDSINSSFQYFFLVLHLVMFPLILFVPQMILLLKIYPYLLSVPIFVDSLQQLNISDPFLTSVCVINIGLNLAIVRVSYLLYMSYSFLSEQDYLADRNLWWVKIIFPFGLAGVRYLRMGLVGGIATCVLSAMILVRETFQFNYTVKHRGYMEMSAMMLISSLMWLAYYFSGSQEKFTTLSLILVFSLILSYLLAEEMVDFVKHQAVYNMDFKTFKKCEDTVRFMFEIRRDFNEDKRSKKKYYGIISNHLQSCMEIDCKCKIVDLTKHQSVNTLFNEMLLDILSRPNDNLTEQRIVLIYYFMQIISQPFRAYFEATKLTKEKLSILNKMEVMLIVREARFKVEVLLKEKKAVNQELNLHKVQDFEKKLIILKDRFAVILRQLISFLELYTLKSLSISQMQDSATELNKKRAQIDRQIEQLHKINPNSKVLISLIKMYYQHFDIYDSKIAKYQKLRHDFVMEQRLFHADQKTMFDEDHGVITINLSENQGKIEYISKNIAALFKIQPDEMLGTNIEAYMPDEHGRHHATILRNFIQKGTVRVLNQTNLFFGRTVNQFIFPIELKIKIETHIAQNFRSTALVRNINSKSGFILLGENGKCEEITQVLYKQLFFQMFQDDLYKLKQVKLKSYMPELYRSDLEMGITYSAYILIPELEEEYGSSRQQSSEMGQTLNAQSTIKEPTLAQGQSSKQQVPQSKTLFSKWVDSTNFLRLECYKVKFRLGEITSSLFHTTIVEIESLKQCTKDRTFYRRLFSSLAHLCDKLDLADYRVRMVAAQRAISKFEDDEDLEILDGINVEFQVNPDEPMDLCESLGGSEQSDQQSLKSNKSEEISQQSQQVEDQSNGAQSQRSSVSSVDYNINKKQLVIDGFRKNTNSDYESIRKMIYFFVAFAILLKFLSLTEKLMFATYENNEDISNCYMQKLSRSFYYYCAFREVAQFYSKDAIYNPLFRNQSSVEQQLFINEWKTNEKLNEDERRIFGFDTVLKSTSILTVEPNIAKEYMDFIKILNEISVEAAVAIQNDTFQPEFMRENLVELVLIFEGLKSSYYSLKQKTLVIRQTFSLYFAIGCEVIYLIFFAVSIPIYMFYNNKKIRLLQFMGNFPSRVIKTELKFFREMESKMLNEEPAGDDEEMDDLSDIDIKPLTDSKRVAVLVEKLEDLVPQSNSKMQFNNVKDNKDTFVCLVLGFFVLYSILNWAIWALAYVYGLQTKASLQTQVSFNSLGTQAPLVIYAFVANMNNLNQGLPINKNLLSVIDQTIYYEILEAEFRRNPKTEYVNSTTSMMINGYCPSCLGLLSKGYFDNVKSIYEKFWYFVQNNFTAFTASKVQNWTQMERLSDLSLNLITLRDWVLKLYGELEKQSNSSYSNYWTLMILFIVGNSILTAILGYFMQKSYIDEICVMINRAESLFKNLSVAVITENGPLLNYFREKLRKK